MQCGRAAVFVCKDLAYQKDFLIVSFEVAAQDTLLWKIEFVYARKTPSSALLRT